MSRIQVAAVHAAPVFLELKPTIEKVCAFIREAAVHGARLIVFPEAFVPAFPVWSALRTPLDNHDLFCRLVANALFADGPEMAQVRETAQQYGIVVSLGFNERSKHSVGAIYNSNVLIGNDGTILNHHRKIVPTFYEKLTWAPGDGAGLKVCDTGFGRVGMLICGENTNPLARYTLMAQGEEIHLSTYPPIWPTHRPDAHSTNYDLAHAIRLRAGAHSFEAKAFTIVSSGFMDVAMFDFLVALHPDARQVVEESPRSVSLITNPNGVAIGDELCQEEGILYTEIDVSECVEPKQIHDVSGGYNRFDIFQLTVNRSRNWPIRFAEAESSLTTRNDNVVNLECEDSETEKDS